MCSCPLLSLSLPLPAFPSGIAISSLSAFSSIRRTALQITHWASRFALFRRAQQSAAWDAPSPRHALTALCAVMHCNECLGDLHNYVASKCHRLLDYNTAGNVRGVAWRCLAVSSLPGPRRGAFVSVQLRASRHLLLPSKSL